MPRAPRSLTVEQDRSGFYHVCNRVAGPQNFLPFMDPDVRRHFINRLLHYLNGSEFRLASLTLMGNHFHMVTEKPAPKRLSHEELRERARYFFRDRWRLYTDRWSEKEWRCFERRLFDLSRLMQIFQSEFARWYNRRLRRRGALWADRFKAIRLFDLQAIQECLLYTELNPIRAGLISTPEQWTDGSAYWRWSGQDQNLIPLYQLFPEPDLTRVWQSYRSRLLSRGSHQKTPPRLPLSRQKSDPKKDGALSRFGLYGRRHRFFTDGLALGASPHIENSLERARSAGFYRRRRHPISQLNGLIYSLREQRSHAFST